MENWISPSEQHQQQGENPQQSTESIDDFSSFLKRKNHDLIFLMATQFGLLNVLESNQVLTVKQVSFIREKDLYTSQVRLLLEEITRVTISTEKKEAFLNALDQTQHKHVDNYIRGRGKRAAEYGDDWPLLYCENGIVPSRLSANKSKLVDLIDPRNGLLDEMLEVKCINNRQKHWTEQGKTDEIKN